MLFNVNHCKLAHDNVLQFIIDNNLDIIFLTEVYKTTKPIGYKVLTNGKVCVMHHASFLINNLPCDKDLDLVAFCFESVHYFLMYVAPMSNILKYLNYVNDFIIKHKITNYVILGDFNARHISWCKYNNRNGFTFQNFILNNNLILQNTPYIPTFENKNGTSTIDLIITSNNIVDNYSVSNLVTFSDRSFLL